MDVLVTGGTGFIGTALCRELHERDHDVTALSRTPDDADLPAGVALVTGDVTDAASIEDAFEGQDAVVHLVALSPLYRPSGGYGRHREVTVTGTTNVVSAAAEHDLDRMVYLGGMGAGPDAPTAYLRAKGQAEEIVRESEVPHTVFKPSVVFGDGGEFIGFTRTLTTPYLTALPGGGRTPFQPIYVEELVELVAEALEDERHANQTYEIGGPEVLTIADVARLAHRARGRSLRVVPVPMPLAGLGLRLLGLVPRAPFGTDQYRSLQVDNRVPDNGVTAFDRDPAELTTVAEYLGLAA